MILGQNSSSKPPIVIKTVKNVSYTHSRNVENGVHQTITDEENIYGKFIDPI